MLGARAIPVSCFWTAYPHISIWSPILASLLFGYGILSVFISTYLYLIDTYEVYAASALTMITLVRYVVSGAIIESSIPMYENLSVQWSLTLLGCIGIVFTFVPYAFFGPRVVLRRPISVICSEGCEPRKIRLKGSKPWKEVARFLEL